MTNRIRLCILDMCGVNYSSLKFSSGEIAVVPHSQRQEKGQNRRLSPPGSECNVQTLGRCFYGEKNENENFIHVSKCLTMQLMGDTDYDIHNKYP